MTWRRRKSGLIVPGGLDRRAFLAGLLTAPALIPSEAHARFVLNQLTGFGGRPPDVGEPAAITFLEQNGNATSATTQTWNNVALGSYFPDRSTMIGFQMRNDPGTTPATCTLAPQSGAPVGTTLQASSSGFGSSSHNVAIYAIFTGAGTSFEGFTLGDLVFTSGTNIQRHGWATYYGRHCNAPAAADATAISTGDVPTQTGQMSLNIWEDGIALAYGFVGAGSASQTWQSPLTQSSSQLSTELRIGGHMNVATTVAGQTLQWSPAYNASSNRGAVSASFRGTSNP